jgi:hypothetical protein
MMASCIYWKPARSATILKIARCEVNIEHLMATAVSLTGAFWTTA